MKRNRIIVGLSVALVLAIGLIASARGPIVPTAMAQGKQDFTLHNKTGMEIHELYICPHSSNDWDVDILGEDTLPTGQSLDITFARKEKAKLWDLRIVDGQGNSVDWDNLNLLQISEVTLHKKGNKVWADVK
jgi:hypothetical protein